MNAKQWVTASILGLSLFTLFSPVTQAQEGEERTVTAVSSSALLSTHFLQPTDQLSTQTFAEEFRMLDINHDLSLNDFDVKQFQAILDNLNAIDLTGLEISTRFRNAQKNQRESFPILYDLDRDGFFSERDVKTFSDVIAALDEGALEGKDIVQKMRLKITPKK